MNRTHNTYRRVDKFFGEMLGRPEIIHVETDFTLIDTNGNGYLYYPECFRRVLETKTVKKMARIFQLGTKIYTRPNVSHTRLEHCKGTYYRTLEVLQNLCEKENVKNLIIKNGYQKYVLAILVRALLHDIGHGPFSHTMETVCNLPKGFHEKIAIRLIKEDPELRSALENIYPGLPELIEETIEMDFLGLNRLLEGQADLDRGDFGPRDSFFADANFKENSIAVSEMFNSITIGVVRDKENDEMKFIPIFGADQIGNLNTFFENRFNNYKNIYCNPKSISYDYVFKAFAETLLKSEENYKLKDFLMHNMGKKPEEIDLEEYIRFDDVEYLKGIMEVADKTKDPVLKKLAQMSLPPREKADDFYYGLMVSREQVDENGNRKYTNESDEQFVRRLQMLSDSKTEYEQNCLTLNNNSQPNIAIVQQELKKCLGIKDEDFERLGIFSWNNKIVSYKNKPGEETYVKGAEGEVYEYSKHPEARAANLRADVSGFCVLIPILEEQGYSEEQIQQVRKIIEENNKKRDAEEQGL